MSATDTSTPIGVARRWGILAASTTAQAASAVMVHGTAFLIPALHDREGLSLATAGLIAAAPTLGVMATLVLWGVLTDRSGERLVLLSGLVLTALFGLVAVTSPSLPTLFVALLLAGAAAASTNAASGRVVVGWFPPQRRGLAMGIRQMAQPVGVGIAAVSMAVAADAHGVHAALWVPTVASALAAAVVLAVVVDPPRPERSVETAANPYREDGYLARIHGVSILLVVPQFVVWTFSLVWLVQDRGWSPAAAGAAGRRGAGGGGAGADRRGPALRRGAQPDAAAALGDDRRGGHDAPARAGGGPRPGGRRAPGGAGHPGHRGRQRARLHRGGRAGRPVRSGRALGLQNTGQFAAASAVPPVAGLAIATLGYPAAFAVAGLFPLAALALVPVRAERALR